MNWNLALTYLALVIFSVIWSVLAISFFGFGTLLFWLMIVGGGAFFGYTLENWPGKKYGTKW